MSIWIMIGAMIRVMWWARSWIWWL